MPLAPRYNCRQHRMTKKPQPLLRWDIYRAAAKARLLGTVEAADADEAIAVAVKEFQAKDPKRLIKVDGKRE